MVGRPITIHSRVICRVGSNDPFQLAPLPPRNINYDFPGRVRIGSINSLTRLDLALNCKVCQFTETYAGPRPSNCRQPAIVPSRIV